MKIIDLTLPIFEGMQLYPGDPEIHIEQIFTIENEGWNMKRFHMNGHDGTHVNVPIHCKKEGKTLNDYNIQDFCGECTLFEDLQDIIPSKGVIFAHMNITREMAEVIIARKSRFVGLSSDFEFNEHVEKFLLNNDILCFEKLANTKKLPKQFFFHGAPLKIQDGDGSPVRAYAIY